MDEKVEPLCPTPMWSCTATIHTFPVGDCVTTGYFLYLRPDFIKYLLISYSSPQSWKKRGPSKPTRSNFLFLNVPPNLSSTPQNVDLLP